MAKAKKHEMTKEELRAPDEVEVVLRGFWENLYNYRMFILVGIGVLVAIGLAVWIIGASGRSGRQDDALALYEAGRAVGAEVGPEEPVDPRIAKLPRPPRFENEAARVAAANNQLTKYVAERGSDGAAELAKVALANNKLNKGDAAGALADVEAWIAAHADSPAMPLVLELKARAQIAAGQRDAAIATLDALSKTVNGLLKAEVLTRIGDLHNPVLNEGAGDAGLAKTAYNAALAALPPEVADDSQLSSITGKPGLRGHLENRLGFLP